MISRRDADVLGEKIIEKKSYKKNIYTFIPFLYLSSSATTILNTARKVLFHFARAALKEYERETGFEYLSAREGSEQRN